MLVNQLLSNINDKLRKLYLLIRMVVPKLVAATQGKERGAELSSE